MRRTRGQGLEGGIGVKKHSRTGPDYNSVFRYGEMCVGVSCGRARDLRWLAEFLCPSFQVLDRGTADYQVSLRSNEKAWEIVQSWGPHPRGRLVDCFYLDTRITRHPIWRSPGDETIVHDEEFGVSYIVSHDDATITILALEDTRLPRLALMRVVRELAMIHSQEHDRMILHGASFLLGRRCFVIAGQKRAGKTSMLIHGLRQTGARYVANDRALVSLEASGARVRGMPSIVTLRPSCLAMFRKVRERLRSCSYYPVLSLSEARRGLQGRIKPWRNGKYNLSPVQFCDLMRVDMVGEARATAILFPRITKARGTMRLRRLSVDQASVRLRGSLFRARSPRKFGGIFAELGGQGNPRRAAVIRFSRQLASQVPCYICELGRDAYSEDLGTIGGG